MGTLVYAEEGRRVAVELAASTLVGRAWCCSPRAHDAACPMYWLELRWTSPSGWAWRALTAPERTRGAGGSLGAEWRRLEARGSSGRVHLDASMWVELVDAAPPESFAVDLETGAVLAGEPLATLLEVRPDGVFPFDAEGAAAQALPDGAVVSAGGRLLRIHPAAPIVATARTRLDLAAARVHVEVDLDAREARLTAFGPGADAGIIVRGECVRVLAAFLAARASGLRGGWLTAADAWAGWVALGGAADSPIERLAFERAKLRTQLARAGAGSVDALFERRREGPLTLTRVRALLGP